MLFLSLSLLLLALLGMPLFAVIAASAMFGFYLLGIDLSVMAIEIYRLTDTSILLAIPFFTFAGYLLGESQAPQRLVQLVQALFAWLPGGFALMALLACAIFTAFTGASGVTIIALGALLYPALQQMGYTERFSLGLVTTSGSLGLLFAPSLPLILYAVIAQQLNLGATVQVEQMFLAGILPCLLMIVLLWGWSIWQHRRKGVLPDKTYSRLTVWQALRAAIWEIPLPLLVLVGIYSGIITVAEAAVLTACYAFLITVVIRREVNLQQLWQIVHDSMVMVGAIMLILAMSLASTNYLIDADIPGKLFAAINQYITSPLMFLFALNIFLLLLGMMLDIFAATFLMIPLLLPIAIAYGIHPVHFGIIFLANMQLGYFTPPVGMNLFIASYRFDKPVWEIYRSTLPFFWLLLLAVLAITYIPLLSLGLL